MNKISWCLDKKNGFSFIDPNDDLANAYIKKAEDALRAASDLQNNPDWEISSSYYAMYFSLYAILMKIGVKSEIHSCTIAFMRELLKDFFQEEEILLIEKAQKARIDVQYYSDRNISDELFGKIKGQRALFVARCKDLLNLLTEENVQRIRGALRGF